MWVRPGPPGKSPTCPAATLCCPAARTWLPSPEAAGPARERGSAAGPGLRFRRRSPLDEATGPGQARVRAPLPGRKGALISPRHGTLTENTGATAPLLRITTTTIPGAAQVLHLNGEVDHDQRQRLESAPTTGSTRPRGRSSVARALLRPPVGREGRTELHRDVRRAHTGAAVQRLATIRTVACVPVVGLRSARPTTGRTGHVVSAGRSAGWRGRARAGRRSRG